MSDQFTPTTPAPDATSEDAPPKRYRYKILLQAPAVLQQLIDSAVSESRLPSDKLNNSLALQVNFRTDNVAQVETTIQNWVNEHLPLETKLLQVFSEVKGRQTYITGWLLDNADTLKEVQRKLATGLSTLITIEATANTNFRPRLAITNSSPAEVFPALVAHLQQNFDETAWTISGCTLVRQEIDAEDKPLPNSKWEAVKQFSKGD